MRVACINHEELYLNPNYGLPELSHRVSLKNKYIDFKRRRAHHKTRSFDRKELEEDAVNWQRNALYILEQAGMQNLREKFQMLLKHFSLTQHKNTLVEPLLKRTLKMFEQKQEERHGLLLKSIIDILQNEYKKEKGMSIIPRTEGIEKIRKPKRRYESHNASLSLSSEINMKKKQDENEYVTAQNQEKEFTTPIKLTRPFSKILHLSRGSKALLKKLRINSSADKPLVKEDLGSLLNKKEDISKKQFKLNFLANKIQINGKRTSIRNNIACKTEKNQYNKHRIKHYHGLDSFITKSQCNQNIGDKEKIIRIRLPSMKFAAADESN